jgi:hypothetical protein
MASEAADGLDEATVQAGRPPQARHLGPVVLPHAATAVPLPGCSAHGHREKSLALVKSQVGEGPPLAGI